MLCCGPMKHVEWLRVPGLQVRSSKQDQIHNSIVSTLLALMDGLDSRGSVVVIGGHCCHAQALLPPLTACISSPLVPHH